MRVEKVICDCCKEEIPMVKKKDIFGIEREYYRLGTLNYFGSPMDCRILGVDLCERCAGNINLEMQRIKTEILLKG